MLHFRASVWARVGYASEITSLELDIHLPTFRRLEHFKGRNSHDRYACQIAPPRHVTSSRLRLFYHVLLKYSYPMSVLEHRFGLTRILENYHFSAHRYSRPIFASAHRTNTSPNSLRNGDYFTLRSLYCSAPLCIPFLLSESTTFYHLRASRMNGGLPGNGRPAHAIRYHRSPIDIIQQFHRHHGFSPCSSNISTSNEIPFTSFSRTSQPLASQHATSQGSAAKATSLLYSTFHPPEFVYTFSDQTVHTSRLYETQSVTHHIVSAANQMPPTPAITFEVKSKG